MPVLKSKMSKSAYVLIAIVVIAIIALPILHLTGIIDLSFLGAGFLGVLIWSSESILNGVLFSGGLFVLGALSYYVVKKYIIGTQLPPSATGAYIPRDVIPQSATPKEEVTVT